MKDTPLHRDTLALCGVLLEDMGEVGTEVLGRHLATNALHLLDDVTLAVAGHRRRDRLEDADAGLRLLRTHLRLAHELGLFDRDLFLDLAGQADLVGRQLGGWLKRLRTAEDGPVRAGSPGRT